MHGVEAVDVGVLVGVCGQGGGVGIRADTGGVVVDPGAHGVVLRPCVGSLEADCGSHEISPAFAHAAGFEGVEAVGVGGPTGETGGDTVGVLVDDYTGFEAAVALGGGFGPDVHPHAAGLAIRRSGEVGVVGAGAVLGVQDDHVIADTTLTVVVGLKVTGRFIEAEGVKKVMVSVRGVEQLRDGSIHIRRWRRHGCCVREAESRTGACWAVVVEVSGSSAWVGLSNTVVATSCGVGCASSTLPCELRGRGVPWVGDDAAGAFGRIIESPRTAYG